MQTYARSNGVPAPLSPRVPRAPSLSDRTPPCALPRVQEMCDIVDCDRDGEISFEEFFAVMTGKLDLDLSAEQSFHRTASGNVVGSDGKLATEHMVANSSRSIRDIKALFDMIDEDGSGYLDREEVRNVSVDREVLFAACCSCPLLLLWAVRYC